MFNRMGIGNRHWSAAALVLALGVGGCTQANQTAQQPDAEAPTASTAEQPQVVATSTVLCDLTEQIAADTIDLTCLLSPNQDPHVYAATPSDRKAIEDADLVLYGGYNYEPGLIRIIQATTTPAAKVAVFEAAVPKPLLGKEHDHGHDHGEEHDHGDETAHDHDHDHTHESETAANPDAADRDHGAEADLVPDPHIWHNALNGVAIARVIETNLSQVAPEHAAQYQQNAAALTRQLTNLDDWIKTQVATVPVPKRKLVTTHEALGYFADAYGFTVAGAIKGLSTEEKPSAARLTELADQLKQSQVPAVFIETTTNPKLIETVAREANVTVAETPLFIEGPGGEGTPAPTYQDMLISNTCTIVNALGGRCDSATAPRGDS
ncbi:MAG: zinc ABC transporter substrate-binding protein [Synechococcales cyanobacterium M58_A2018_015]|nr:zinc ABC transporter substrate-binding protein [Synechococcales cyanobacterium M58_A2018_015]